MANNNALTEEERAELEALRAEKAAREEAQKAAAERAELEALRAEKVAAEPEPEPEPAPEPAPVSQPVQAAQPQPQDQFTPEELAAREHGRKLMEPDEDLKMGKGQKLVLIAIFVVAIAWFLVTTLA